MDENMGISVIDPCQYRSEAVAATAFNQPLRKRTNRPTSKYYSFFKGGMQSNCVSKTIDFEAGKKTCQLAREGDLEGLKSALDALEVTLKEQYASGATLLHFAARGNQVKVMRYLIENGIAPDSRDNDGNTSLHVSVQEGSVDAVDLLLNSGASDAILNSEQDAAIHLAIKLNRMDVVEVFLDHSINLLVLGYRKRTVLHIAAELDRVEIYKMVHTYAQARGNGMFNLCIVDEDNLTPTHLAARKGSHRILHFFMEVCKDHGYPNETILSFLDEENSTPLHAAIDGGHAAVVDVLLKYGASPLDSKYGHPPPVHMACSQGKLDILKVMVNYCGPAILHKVDEHGRTPLHFSANSMRSGKLISYIMQYDANVNAADDQNRTALHIAIMSGSLIAVQKLLSEGANPIISDRHGNNALHYAAIYQRKAIINYLAELPCALQLCLDRGINNGCSPVDCALKLGYRDCLIPLINVIGDHIQDMRDSKGNTLLHLAAVSGDNITLESLFAIPASSKLLNEVSNTGATPLHCAAAGQDCSRCVKILLEHGATSHKCHYGTTPYMVACLKGNTVCAMLLYQAFPFQRDWTDNNGNTSLHLAVVGGSHETVRLALDVGTQMVHNFNEESFFDVIIKKADTQCALAAVKHDRWQECLDHTSPHFPHPMIGLILHMPNIAKKVLDRCQVTSTLNKSHREYWETFCFKYVRLQIVKQCHHSLHGDYIDTESNMHSETSSMTDLDIPTINYKGSPKHRAHIAHIVKHNFHSTEALQAMVKYNRVSLLTHPVVHEYLGTKWRDYGRSLYYFSVMLHVLHILFLSIFVTVVPLPTDSRDTNINFVSNQNGSTNLTQTNYQLTTAANGIRIITLLLCTINVLPFFSCAYLIGIKGFVMLPNTANVAQFATILCTYIFLIPSIPLWPAGAIATFCGWFTVVASNVFGLYGTMFLRICRTVLTVMMVSFILLLSFSFSLHLLAFALPDFSTIGYSLFSTFGYMLGEIQYHQIVAASISGSFKFRALVFIFIITLAILMSIVMVNLLIGLAVGDIDKIRLNAIAEAVTFKTHMFTRIDGTLPTRIREHCERHFHKTYPNAYRSKLFKYIDLGFQNFKKILNECNEVTETKDQCNQAAELTAIRQQLFNLTSIVKDLGDREQTSNRLTRNFDSTAFEKSSRTPYLGTM